MSRLADLERHAGPLADGSYLVGHAAAAAFMGGVDRAVVATVPGFDDLEALAAAAIAALDGGATALVAPGLSDLAGQRALAAAFDAWREAPDAPDHAGLTTLWLDAPSGADADAALAHRDALGGDRRALWVVTPWARALAPGRPRADLVPGSAVVGALALRSAPALGALVSLERRYTAPEIDALAEAGGVAVLVPVGPRQLVGLRAAAPSVPHPASDEIAELTSDPIERAVRSATAVVLADPPRGDALGLALERAARPALRRRTASGHITACAGHCEEGVPSVRYRTPTRVAEVRVVALPR